MSRSRTFLALALLVVAACTADGILRPAAQLTTTTTTYEVLNPTTHQLEVVSPPSAARAPGIALSVATPPPPPVLAANAPAISRHGAESRQFSFTTASGLPAKIVWLYGPAGGPPAVMQSYRNHVLVSTNWMTWTRTATGWVQASSVLSLVNNATLVGRVTTTTTPCRTNCGPAQMVRSHQVESLLYALASATSACAHAQWYNMHFGACRAEWVKYDIAFAAFYAASVTAVAVRGIGVVSAVALASLEQAVADAESTLRACMEQQPEASDSTYQGGPTNWNASGGPGSGGSGSGSAGSADCLQGSYAAHCSTPFTL